MFELVLLGIVTHTVQGSVHQQQKKKTLIEVKQCLCLIRDREYGTLDRFPLTGPPHQTP